MIIVVPNQLYSFHYTQVPGFERIYELARQHSYAPTGFDDGSYQKLAPEHRVFARRATLGNLPNEEAILRREYELSQQKDNQPTPSVARDVETPDNRQILEGLTPHKADMQTTPSDGELARRQMDYRKGSGYVKLDERKSRLVELRFFAGLTSEDAAEVLGISRTTASEEWRMARAWLYRELKDLAR